MRFNIQFIQYVALITAQGSLPVDAVQFGMVGIVGDHIPAATGPFTGKDFFDAKIIGDDFKAPRMGQCCFVDKIRGP